MALQSTKTAQQRHHEDLLAELQERLSQSVTGFADSSEEAQKRRYEEALASTEAFGQAYLPHYFEDESAAFHYDLDRMTAMRREYVHVVHGPREHAKSTRCRAGLLRRVLAGELHYPLLVSEELGLAIDHLVFFIAELTSNARIEEDFGVEIVKKNMSKGVLRLRVTPKATGVSHTLKMEAISYGSKVKGKIHLQYRPDFALADDMEDGVSSRNPRIGKEKVDWILQDLDPAVKGGPIIWIGNTARDTSALFQAMLECYDSEDDLRDFLKRGTDPGGNIPPKGDRPAGRPGNAPETPSASAREAGGEEEAESDDDLRQMSAYCYRAIRVVEHEDGSSETIYLWPERNSPRWYKEKRATMGRSRFEGEMNGCPVAIGVFFDEEWFPTYEVIPEGWTWLSWCDPAFGESSSACYKAVVVVASDGRRFLVVDAWLRQTEPVSSMIRAWHTLFERWGPHAPGPGELRQGKHESNFKQDDRLRRDIDDEEKAGGFSLPVSGDPNTAPKDARIESLEGLASNNKIQWPARSATWTYNRNDVDRLKRQTLGWPDGYDDGPDALESCISRLRRIAGGLGRTQYESLGKRRYRGGRGRRRR